MTCVWSRTRRPSSARGGVSMGRARSLRQESREATHGSALEPGRGRRGRRGGVLLASSPQPARGQADEGGVDQDRQQRGGQRGVVDVVANVTGLLRATWTRMNENSPIWVRPTPTQERRRRADSRTARTTSRPDDELADHDQADDRDQQRQVSPPRGRIDERADRDEEERRTKVSRTAAGGPASRARSRSC